MKILITLRNEIWYWVEALFRWIPGRIGWLIRHFLYRPMIHGSGRLMISEYVHIWESWKMVCGSMFDLVGLVRWDSKGVLTQVIVGGVSTREIKRRGSAK